MDDQASALYEQTKQKLIEELLRSAEMHEAGQIWEIDGSWELLEGDVLKPDTGPDFDKLIIAFEFWSGWIDSRNHDWLYYEGIKMDDWPRLARQIVDDLNADRETVEERITRHFDYRNRVKGSGVWSRLAGLLKRKE